jgi:membrane protein
MTLVEIGKRSITAFGEDKAQRLASSVAFSAIFSIAPLFIVLIAILGAFLGSHGAAQDKLLDVVRSSAGSSAADTIRQIIASSFAKPRQGVIAQVIGWGVFIVGASNLFASLQDALNSIWGVEKTKGGWRQVARDRAVSGGMIVVIGLILIMTFIGNGAVAFLTSHLAGNAFAGQSILLGVIAQLLTFAVVTIVFTLLFKVLPDVRIAWRHAWFGGFITAVLFTIGQTLIGIYFTRGGVTSAYGAAGSLLVALLWIYYSIIILLFGAEVTKVTADKAELTAASAVRSSADRPAGTDPRSAFPSS